ncbi:TPA: hypothetical protein HA318_03365 [Candidatus Micrarchaeota archaeon]|nr:MAG: hypothetical protein AUJ65_01325 [Candidatus Micrarchaeota archaeon CG1_02_51_15]HII39015.1 hypothetical protein [Candidatus Micrarchaeota archaeon]
MNWKPRFSEEFTEDFRGLDKLAREVVAKLIRKIIASPERNKRFTGPLAGCLRERFLQYQIVYRFNEAEKTVDFIRLKKRGHAYESSLGKNRFIPCLPLFVN